MKCWNCGNALTEHNFCPACGADVDTFKKIIRISNKYYNDGLEKAKVRDLTGAIDSLKMSLKYNKRNIHARNLLGLVYYETGEIVAALGEWVISKNMRPNKNIVDAYIKAVQDNPQKLETTNQSIKKFNLALTYCNQETYDLAVIQLKKVLSTNPKLIKGRQLLALLYIRENQYDKALKELKKAEETDRCNPLTIRYLKELERYHKVTEKTVNDREEKQKKKEPVHYKVGNDTVIQPTVYKENNGLSVVLNIAIGLVLGAALVYFLVVPGKQQIASREAGELQKSHNEQLAAKDASIADLEDVIASLEAEVKELETNLDGYEGKGGVVDSYEKLLSVVTTYTEGDAIITYEALSTITDETVKEVGGNFETTYQTIKTTVQPEAATAYFERAEKNYNNRKFKESIPDYEKCYELDPKNDEALYRLGRAYQKTDDKDKAKKVFDELIKKFPNNKTARDAKLHYDD